jgi:hypothetical protein
VSCRPLNEARDGGVDRRRGRPDRLDQSINHLGGEAHVVSHGPGSKVLDAVGVVLKTLGERGEAVKRRTSKTRAGAGTGRRMPKPLRLRGLTTPRSSAA